MGSDCNVKLFKWLSLVCLEKQRPADARIQNLKPLPCSSWCGQRFPQNKNFPRGRKECNCGGCGWKNILFSNVFFFLRYGRSRSKARSLHEKKLLVRKLLHGRRWSHAAWQIITTKTQTKNTRQDVDPPARFASHHPKDSKANSERGKSPTRTTIHTFQQCDLKKDNLKQNTHRCTLWEICLFAPIAAGDCDIF